MDRRGENRYNAAKRYTHNGITLTLREWCERVGAKRVSVDYRLRHGWSFERAITEPMRIDSKTHGHSYTPDGKQDRTYKTWRSMKERCLNKNHPAYKNYGGRGITVAQEWMDFAAFLADMGESPEGMTLDRIDNSKGYSKDNCRWANWIEQARNTRRTKLITWKGETRCQREWEDVLGFNRGVLMQRLAKGWDIDRALSQPVRQTRLSKSGNNDAQVCR